ncbi:MAG TPA: DUF1587 domain-containing protein, partial [Polyangiaceae bacterium]|nr:DUF1587 domain-containing protein [Polyangiaceae bacterium]
MFLGAALTRNSDDLTPSNEALLLDALPAGHTVSTVVRAPEAYEGLWFLGHYFADDNQFVKRMAVRWYRYYSPNYEMSASDGPLCEQRGKITEAHINYTSHGVGFAAYNFYNWTPNGEDCCNGPQNPYPSVEELRGKWWRFEYVMTDRNGPGHNSLLYVKNVTDGEPEQLVYDFSALSFWSPEFTPPSPTRALRTSQYAQGTCLGFAALSHYMAAGWDSDEGQRIGPAVEIEGPSEPGTGGAGSGGRPGTGGAVEASTSSASSASGGPTYGDAPDVDQGCSAAGPRSSRPPIAALLMFVALVLARRRRAMCGLAALAASTACVGNIGGESPVWDGLAPTSGVRRLSSAEYDNSLRDLLHVELPASAGVFPGDSRTPFDN